ncbi:MAG: metal-binding protein [Cyanobacteriota bacterium]
MASGAAHDRLTQRLALPLALVCWPLIGPTAAVAVGLAFLLGGLWLSPDLDTRSRPSRRWGPLAVLWLPYRRLVRHRGWISHLPLLGSAGRLAYLALLLLLLSGVLQPLGLPGPRVLVSAAIALWQRQQPLLLAALLGVEASAWLHLIQDGDPLPLPPGRRRR